MCFGLKDNCCFLNFFQTNFVSNFYILKIIHSLYKVKNEITKFALFKSCNFTPKNSKTYGENGRCVALSVPEI